MPAALVAGALFGALHWPNPVLVPLTFVGGVAMAWLFATERNILVLALGQALLGALVWWAFPIAWHHSMRVGAGVRNVSTVRMGDLGWRASLRVSAWGVPRDGAPQMFSGSGRSGVREAAEEVGIEGVLSGAED